METNILVSLNTREVREILSRIIQTGTPLRRKKKDGTYGFIPPEEFDLYLKQHDMDFYIDEHSLERIRFNGTTKSVGIVRDAGEHDPAHESHESDSDFLERLEAVKGMTIEERIQSLTEGNLQLKSFASDGRKFNSEVMNNTGKIFSDSLCVNKTTLEENLLSPHQNESLQRIAKETYELIINLLSLMARGKTSFRDLAKLSNIETGSVTIDHMNRILIRFISFLFFYNGYFQKYSNEVKKFRAHFTEKYAEYYNKITKGSQKNSLEIVFKDGIAPVKDKTTFVDYCMGGLMHDIGKMPFINYHDSDEGYDREKATRHVFDGYNMLVNSKHYSQSTLSTALLHHDYYSAPFGYNQLKTFQSRFIERRKEQRNISVTRYFISYNVLDVGYNNSLSYFPIKVLELLDVFDAMTDSNKKYRKRKYSIEDALKELRFQYIEGAHLGVDPILYNIFIDFLHVSGIIIDPGAVEFLKI